MKILVGMSGGIDSTYAALKLKNEGHHVEGAVLVMHEYTETELALSSGRELGIPVRVVDVKDAFYRDVVPNFISEYKNGRTPNPCIICNGAVKFKYLLEYALANGFEAIATGHYARIARTNEGKNAIARAADGKKDQSYMLWRLSDEVLSHLILPLGEMTKDEIRENAKALGLSAHDRPDSQEICFIPDGDYVSYIESRTGACAHGDFIDDNGNVIGEHKGIIRYTVGQRKGLGIAASSRISVTDIDPEANTVTLSPTYSEASSLTVSDPIFSGMHPLRVGEEAELEVKLRYAAPPIKCRVRRLENGKLSVDLDAPARAVTAGQSAVFYKEGVLMFGAFIDKKQTEKKQK